MRLTQLLASALTLSIAAATPLTGQKQQEEEVQAPREAFKFKRGLPSTRGSQHLRPVFEAHQEQPVQTEPEPNAPGCSSGSFAEGQTTGGTNRGIDIHNPSNLGQESTDAGVVPNLKWRFSDSKTRLLKGGWAEWGFVYSGRIGVSAVDEDGRNSYDVLGVGDVWYFPKGAAHTIHGLSDEAEYLLVFDEGDFDAFGTTFNLADWITHTPKDILAKDYGCTSHPAKPRATVFMGSASARTFDFFAGGYGGVSG
ncbi:Putative rmlC-like cupin domain superfamily, rmlC-like jelly roll protein [Septoria linicola]|uniref:RmlC-like cupin domain superfamily, rmlC-like jelly roll protein n=1 Tax=Septoria linicola TaxID=215465 RepID=A0A9Q9EMZ1_9PEZI|nr:Putative rmlC-like cupin domain superfamily, rmlC-like jelly roll protein [Septoria linicola]